MPRVVVEREISIRVGSAAVHYPAGYSGPAPEAHILLIVEAGAGRRLTRRGDVGGDASLDESPRD